MSQEVSVYILKVDRKSISTKTEEWIMVIDDHVIHTGTWMTGVEEYVQGILTGLELAHITPKTKIIEIHDDEQYERVSRGEIDLEALSKMAGV